MEMPNDKKGEKWVDFREVKRQVSLEQVLNHYGIPLRQRVKCPLPTHQTQSDKSFSANLEKGIWSCLSESCIEARGGKRGGNVLDLVALIENCSIREAALKMKNWFAVISEATAPAAEKPHGEKPKEKSELVAEKKNEERSENGENKVLGFELKGIDHSHVYLAQRGITKETAEFFGCGFFPGKGTMSGRIVIPISNATGELVAYAGRWPGDPPEGESKYKLPVGFHKSKVLFNFHRATHPDTKTIIVVEGYFDAMKVHQAGFKNVVALMGSSISDSQEKLIAGKFNQVILCLDGDDAGRKGAAEIAGRLARKMFVRILDFPDGKQPDQLASEELKTLLDI